MGEETLNNFDRERGLELLTMMERIRAFEENAVLAAERDKLVLGAIHPSFGQEATAAGNRQAAGRVGSGGLQQASAASSRQRQQGAGSRQQ